MILMLTVIIAAAAMLVVYSMIEKRINQRACPECGFAMSADAIEEQCPRCDSIFHEDTPD